MSICGGKFKIETPHFGILQKNRHKEIDRLFIFLKSSAVKNIYFQKNTCQKFYVSPLYLKKRLDLQHNTNYVVFIY